MPPLSDLFSRSVSFVAHNNGLGLPIFVIAHSEALRRDVGEASEWVRQNRTRLDTLLVEHGAYVLRGFAVPETASFSRMIQSYPYAELDYTAGATPRAEVQGRIYEATKTPADYWIGLHQEMSYLPNYPEILAFFCSQPADSGGETVIADLRRFEAAMPARIRDAMMERGIRYIRNFRAPGRTSGHPRLDLAHKDWANAFNTVDPTIAERKAHGMGLTTRWLDDGGLEVSHVSSGFADHSVTGSTIWFNQMTTQFICRENLGPRADLWLEYYTKRGRPLPYTSTWGDGEEVAAEDRNCLYRIFDEIMVAFPWQQGDVMVLDNLLTAHGRNPYSGLRDVQVAMLAYGVA